MVYAGPQPHSRRSRSIWFRIAAHYREVPCVGTTKNSRIEAGPCGLLGKAIRQLISEEHAR
jgi:hypothetical protein